VAEIYLVGAQTNGAGSASLPALTSLSPPNPPTLAYFQSKSAKFVDLQIRPLKFGIQPIMAPNNIDVVLVYSDGTANVHPGPVPGHVTVTAGIANGQYIDRSLFKPA